jgi:predicted XRE-type DNA-binding protein
LSSKRRKAIEFEESSGNIFANLAFEDSDSLYVRAQIGFYILKILEAKKLKPGEISRVLGLGHADLPHLMNGHFSRFGTDRVIDFLNRLDRKVKIEITRRHKGDLTSE